MCAFFCDYFHSFFHFSFVISYHRRRHRHLFCSNRSMWRIIFLILFFFCSFNVIIAFATNYLLQQGVENATTTARYGVSDTQEFMKTTSQQANHILVKNYDELTNHLELMLMGQCY